MARQRPLGSQRNPLGRQSEGCLALVPRQHAPQVAYTHLERTYPGPKPAFFNRLLGCPAYESREQVTALVRPLEAGNRSGAFSEVNLTSLQEECTMTDLAMLGALRLRVIMRAEELGNVSQACREFRISRTTF